MLKGGGEFVNSTLRVLMDVIIPLSMYTYICMNYMWILDN